jgi:hypothetical protein
MQGFVHAERPYGDIPVAVTQIAISGIFGEAVL